MVVASDTYAARLDIDYPERLDRLTSFFRLIWIIPIAIVLNVLSAYTSQTVRTVTDNAVTTTVLQGTVSTLGGSLCVRVYDVGALTESVSYTMVVSHP